MSQNIEIEIYLLIDEDGQYAVASDQEEIVPAYEEEFGQRPATTNHYVLKLGIPFPAPTELLGNVSAGAGEYGLEIKKRS